MEFNKNSLRPWVVYDYYSVAGCPKMEKALMDYARKHYMRGMVYENKIDLALVKPLQDYQEQLHKKNPRWQPVEISAFVNDCGPMLGALRIGQQYLRLIKVAGEL